MEQRKRKQSNHLHRMICTGVGTRLAERARTSSASFSAVTKNGGVPRFGTDGRIFVRLAVHA